MLRDLRKEKKEVVKYLQWKKEWNKETKIAWQISFLQHVDVCVNGVSEREKGDRREKKQISYPYKQLAQLLLLRSHDKTWTILAYKSVDLKKDENELRLRTKGLKALKKLWFSSNLFWLYVENLMKSFAIDSLRRNISCCRF